MHLPYIQNSKIFSTNIFSTYSISSYDHRDLKNKEKARSDRDNTRQQIKWLSDELVEGHVNQANQKPG